jgi:hypothetical protein
MQGTWRFRVLFESSVVGETTSCSFRVNAGRVAEFREWEATGALTRRSDCRFYRQRDQGPTTGRTGTGFQPKYPRILGIRLIPLRQGPQNVGTGHRSVIEHITNYGGLR